ncbi:MAG: 1,4-alpha-glucan branching protein GlgB [Alistipes sp.]|nr:1,4-alpha-glucan branching protein GlgB [Alistipes sp.]
MGAHLTTFDGKEGVYFSVWAPRAKMVYVIGEFNNWNETEYPMHRISDGGIYDRFIPGVKEGQLYKFLIITQSGQKLYKADPYANASEMRPGTASRVTSLEGYKWGDAKWVETKTKADHLKEAMMIYECQLGSWKKKNDGTEDGFYNYREIAPELAAYVKDMGYTHIELMGIAEYPFDASWGYQVTGYYAPTSRYGTPKDFMYFVDYMHKNGIGIILDWVPAHFPRDAHGLANFDGTATYEYADPRKGEHPDWGTKVFDYGRTEVVNFLIANALFWIDKFHIDGLRVDAVASMLYLDYGRRDGQWVANKYGGNGNLEAMDFLRHLNKIVNDRFPRAITIAEESTAWPAVSGVVGENDSLGFTFKWNMGWMHDFLEYMKCDPLFRKGNHHKMTFSLMYAYSERFILVLSHDEVVHLKCSMLNKMPGEYEDKFKNLKTAYTYMVGHPGKKLLFMGQEFGQPTEWSEARSLDWHVASEPQHKALQEYVKGLFHLYQKYPALYETDYNPDGFMWSNANDNENSVYSFMRFSPTGKKSLLFVINFTPVERGDYVVGVADSGKFKLIMDENGKAEGEISSVKKEFNGCDYSMKIDLTPYGVRVYEFNHKKQNKKKTVN